ncbi:general stress protein CsbD [Curtobacterium sp. MCBA15_007]|uniref:CsbD family protein n=1 Tax=Curtobacterium TaxID=2034 RepID=UPI0005ACE039|nr:MULTISPECIES: CsbD family protein [Curtobacterium]KIP98835.1 general stress protein CsbD [Curtobacterium flaccumfaciens]OII01484.1 general stress protein CsbD [Curtobacterium sp. MCBA15_007]
MGLDDKIKNAAQDIAGKAKEAVGDHKGDDSLKAEGQKDQAAASTKKVGEDVKDVFK